MAIDFTKSYPIIEWDLNNSRFLPKYFGKKEENARGFKVLILQDGEVLTPSTETLRIYCKKKDGTSVYVDSSSIVDTHYIIHLTNQVFAVAGVVECELQLNSGGKWIYSDTFGIKVNDNLVDGSIISTDDFIALQNALNDINTLEDMYAPRLISVESNKIDKASIVNNGTTTVNGTVLDGKMGKILQDQVNSMNNSLNTLNSQINEKASQIDVNLKADKSYVDLKTQAVSLAYKESFEDSLSLQTAYPTGDIFNHVVLADHMIYTWSNNLWINTNIQANGTGIADGTVTYLKTDFLNAKKGKNQIDNSLNIMGYRVDESTGALITSATYKATDFTEINNTDEKCTLTLFNESDLSVYTTSITTRFGFYDSNKNFISGAGITVTAGKRTFDKPASAKYIRISPSVDTSQLLFMLEEGAVSTGVYEEFQLNLEFVNSEYIKGINDGSISKSKLEAKLMSDLNNDRLLLNTTNAFISSSTNPTHTEGEIVSDAVYKTTDAFTLPEGTKIRGYVKRTSNIVFISSWSADGSAFISSLEANTTSISSNGATGERVFEFTFGENQYIRVCSNSTIEWYLSKKVIADSPSQSFDQSLNTTDSVVFSELEVTGIIPQGTLASPPVGLAIGDVWSDITDSLTNPILRIKVG